MTQELAPKRNIPLLFLPIVWLWRFVTFLANLTGILLALTLGVALMAVGLLLTWTVIGAVIGIPLFILGFMLLLRALY